MTKSLKDAESEKRLNASFDQVFRNLLGVEREFVLSLLGKLFPKVNVYRKARGLATTDLPSESEANRQSRIYHPVHFMTYFSLHVQEGYVSTQELEDLVASTNATASQEDAKTQFIKYLRSLTGLKRYRFFRQNGAAGRHAQRDLSQGPFCRHRA